MVAALRTTVEGPPPGSGVWTGIDRLNEHEARLRDHRLGDRGRPPGAAGGGPGVSVGGDRGEGGCTRPARPATAPDHLISSPAVGTRTGISLGPPGRSFRYRQIMTL